MGKKLLVVGSDSVHIYNFIALVETYFDDVLLLTNKKNSNYVGESIEVDFHLGFTSLRTIKQIDSIANEFKPTTIHIHQANTYALLTLFSLRTYNCQKILTAWGSDILLNPKKNFFFKAMVKYILNQVDCVTADSDTVLNEAKKILEKKLEVHNINFGVIVPKCNGSKENIIYSNRQHKEFYNIDKVILSFERFLKKSSNWKLIIAGSGPRTDELKKLVRQLSLDRHVECIGWVDAKKNYELYCKAKIYVSIPKSDSVSISLVEAIACGCIPFVSNLPANREIIQGNGFIVSELDTIAFEQYSEMNESIFVKKQKEIVEHFSKEKNKERYLKIYQRVENENEN